MSKISQIERELNTFQELLDEVVDDEEISSIRDLVQDFVNDLSGDLFFNLDVQRLINKFLWETREVLGFSCMSDTFSAYGDGFVDEISFGKLNVNFFNSKYHFVLPDEMQDPIISGSGNGFEEKETHPRLRLMYEVLSEWGVEHALVYEGTILSTQFRKVPYKLFIIEELDRAVLICEESGNRTFVKSGLSNLEKFSFSRKSELKEMGDVRNIVWNGAENWKERMAELLVLDFETDGGGALDEESVGEVREDDLEIEESERGGEEDLGKDESVEKRRFPKMNREYFTQENVRRDLDAYCAKAALNDVSELSMSDLLQGIEVVCTNGETVKFNTYLTRASKVLSDEELTEAQTLDKLKIIYGLDIEVREVKKEEYPKMNREYFCKENVRRDLDAYCAKAALNDVSELSMSNKFKGIEVVCSNGEPVKFQKYLSSASKVLSDEKLTYAQVLDKLKIIYGLKIEVREVIRKEYPKMNREYFSEENVRRDLEAYCAKAGLNDISELSISNKCREIKVVCRNGEALFFASYLERVSKFLSDNKLTQKQALNVLKKMIS